MEEQRICPCCKQQKVCDNEWGEVSADLVKTEVHGRGFKYTYKILPRKYFVCKKCYKMLQRNSLIIPVITWLIPIVWILLALFVIPFLKVLLVTIGVLFIGAMANNLNSFYSFFGALLRPIFGRYEVGIRGSMEGRREMEKRQVGDDSAPNE